MNQDVLQAPIIFIGPGRSGSTIVSEFIFEHESLAWLSHQQEHMPHAMWVNNLKYLFDNPLWRLTGEKSQINKTRKFNSIFPRPAEAYSFWEAVVREELDFARGFLIGETATAEEKQRIRKAIRSIVTRQGKKRFAAKLTGPGRVGYLKSIFPDAVFINVIRNPANTVKSLMNVDFWQDNGRKKLWWTGAYSEQELELYEQNKSDEIWGTTFQVAKIMDTTIQEAQQFNANMLTVKYEDFVADTQGTVNDIMKFAGLAPSKHVDKKIASATVHNQNRRTKQDDNEYTQAVTRVFGKDFCY